MIHIVSSMRGYMTIQLITSECMICVFRITCDIRSEDATKNVDLIVQ